MENISEFGILMQDMEMQHEERVMEAQRKLEQDIVEEFFFDYQDRIQQREAKDKAWRLHQTSGTYGRK